MSSKELEAGQKGPKKSNSKVEIQIEGRKERRKGRMRWAIVSIECLHLPAPRLKLHGGLTLLIGSCDGPVNWNGFVPSFFPVLLLNSNRAWARDRNGFTLGLGDPSSSKNGNSKNQENKSKWVKALLLRRQSSHELVCKTCLDLFCACLYHDDFASFLCVLLPESRRE